MRLSQKKLGCLKLTYRQEPDFRVIYSKKELTLKNSSQKVYSSYLHLFNGMESDPELKGLGNSYDFGARMLDSRLGRFLSIDANSSQTNWESGYVGFGDNPVYHIDSDGNKIKGGIKARKMIKQHQARINANIVQYRALANMARINNQPQAALQFDQAANLFQTQKGNIESLKESKVVYHFKLQKSSRNTQNTTDIENYTFNIVPNESKRNKDNKGWVDITISDDHVDASLAYSASIGKSFEEQMYSFASGDGKGNTHGSAFGSLADVNDIRRASTAALSWEMVSTNPSVNPLPTSQQLQNLNNEVNSFIGGQFIQNELGNRPLNISYSNNPWRSDGHRDVMLNQDIYISGGIVTGSNPGWLNVIKKRYGDYSYKESDWSSPKTRDRKTKKANK